MAYVWGRYGNSRVYSDRVTGSGYVGSGSYYGSNYYSAFSGNTNYTWSESSGFYGSGSGVNFPSGAAVNQDVYKASGPTVYRYVLNSKTSLGNGQYRYNYTYYQTETCTATDTKGSYVDQVTSETYTDYPTDSANKSPYSYWYVYLGPNTRNAFSSQNTGWTDTANAYGNSDSDVATAAPNANSSLSMELFEFDVADDAAKQIADIEDDFIITVAWKVRWMVDTDASDATLKAQMYLGGSAQGSEFQNTSEPTSLTTDTISSPGTFTRAQLNTFTSSGPVMKITASRGSSGTSFTASVAWAQLEITYSVRTHASITAPVLASEGAAQDPSVTAVQNVSATITAMEASADAQAPSISAGLDANTTAPVMESGSGAEVPSVSTIRNASAAPDAMTAQAEANVPIAENSVSVSVSITAMDASAGSQAPSVRIDAAIAAVVAAASAQVPTPVVSIVIVAAFALAGSLITDVPLIGSNTPIVALSGERCDTIELKGSR